MRKIVLAIVFVFALASQAKPARADFGLGLFLGEPTGLDVKIGIGSRSGLDIVLGFDTFRTRGGYGHLTYLLTPIVGHGDAVIVPMRLGIGAALSEPATTSTSWCACRSIALRLRRTPLEFYGEIAPALTPVRSGTTRTSWSMSRAESAPHILLGS
jgi:hypothetical protein